MTATAVAQPEPGQRPKAEDGAKGRAVLRGAWKPEEDAVLRSTVESYGTRNWTDVAAVLNVQLGRPPASGRTGKQCRERWTHHLRPDIRTGGWTEEEDRVIIEAHKALGNKWREIALRLTGRTETAVKNHWNSTVRQKIEERQHPRKPGDRAPGMSLLKQYIVSLGLKPGQGAAGGGGSGAGGGAGGSTDTDGCSEDGDDDNIGGGGDGSAGSAQRAVACSGGGGSEGVGGGCNVSGGCRVQDSGQGGAPRATCAGGLWPRGHTPLDTTREATALTGAEADGGARLLGPPTPSPSLQALPSPSPPLQSSAGPATQAAPAASAAAAAAGAPTAAAFAGALHMLAPAALLPAFAAVPAQLAQPQQAGGAVQAAVQGGDAAAAAAAAAATLGTGHPAAAMAAAAAMRGPLFSPYDFAAAAALSMGAMGLGGVLPAGFVLHTPPPQHQTMHHHHHHHHHHHQHQQQQQQQHQNQHAVAQVLPLPLPASAALLERLAPDGATVPATAAAPLSGDTAELRCPKRQRLAPAAPAVAVQCLRALRQQPPVPAQGPMAMAAAAAAAAAAAMHPAAALQGYIMSSSAFFLEMQKTAAAAAAAMAAAGASAGGDMQSAGPMVPVPAVALMSAQQQQQERTLQQTLDPELQPSAQQHPCRDEPSHGQPHKEASTGGGASATAAISYCTTAVRSAVGASGSGAGATALDFCGGRDVGAASAPASGSLASQVGSGPAPTETAPKDTATRSGLEQEQEEVHEGERGASSPAVCTCASDAAAAARAAAAGRTLPPAHPSSTSSATAAPSCQSAGTHQLADGCTFAVQPAVHLAAHLEDVSSVPPALAGARGRRAVDATDVVADVNAAGAVAAAITATATAGATAAAVGAAAPGCDVLRTGMEADADAGPLSCFTAMSYLPSQQPQPQAQPSQSSDGNGGSGQQDGGVPQLPAPPERRPPLAMVANATLAGDASGASDLQHSQQPQQPLPQPQPQAGMLRPQRSRELQEVQQQPHPPQQRDVVEAVAEAVAAAAAAAHGAVVAPPLLGAPPYGMRMPDAAQAHPHMSFAVHHAAAAAAVAAAVQAQAQAEAAAAEVGKVAAACTAEAASVEAPAAGTSCAGGWTGGAACEFISGNSVKRVWTEEESRALAELVAVHGEKKWCWVARELNARFTAACQQPQSNSQHQLMAMGGGGWPVGGVLEGCGRRSAKQCRERWLHHLKPDMSKKTWNEAEEWALVAAHAELGNRWADIARRLGGRSENTVKNHWNTALRRKQPSRYEDMRISVLDRYQAARGFKKFPPEAEEEVMAAAAAVGTRLPVPGASIVAGGDGGWLVGQVYGGRGQDAGGAEASQVAAASAAAAGGAASGGPGVSLYPAQAPPADLLHRQQEAGGQEPTSAWESLSGSPGSGADDTYQLVVHEGGDGGGVGAGGRGGSEPAGGPGLAISNTVLSQLPSTAAAVAAAAGPVNVAGSAAMSTPAGHLPTAALAVMPPSDLHGGGGASVIGDGPAATAAAAAAVHSLLPPMQPSLMALAARPLPSLESSTLQLAAAVAAAAAQHHRQHQHRSGPLMTPAQAIAAATAAAAATVGAGPPPQPQSQPAQLQQAPPPAASYHHLHAGHSQLLDAGEMRCEDGSQQSHQPQPQPQSPGAQQHLQQQQAQSPPQPQGSLQDYLHALQAATGQPGAAAAAAAVPHGPGHDLGGPAGGAEGSESRLLAAALVMAPGGSALLPQPAPGQGSLAETQPDEGSGDGEEHYMLDFFA